MARLRAGVLGWPVSHSLSPKLHNHWLKSLGLDGEYAALAVEPEHLKETLLSLAGRGWQGCNLTLPHKERALILVDEVDETARMIGAVNTITLRAGGLIGSNTDAYGFAENIRPHLKGKDKAVILGAGGAARAVCYALAQEGFDGVIITNRTMSRARELAVHFGAKFSVCEWEWRAKIIEDADLVVNATSLGLKGGEAFDLDLRALPKKAVVTDIVYSPLITPLLAAARARGNTVVDGLGMLIHQAVPGFKAWFGATPPLNEELKTMLLS